MTVVCFIHDAPLVEDPASGRVYSQGFSYSVWERYLEVFESLVVSTRMRVGSTQNLVESSGPKVGFKPVLAYRGARDLLTRFPKIYRELQDAVDGADAVILRLPSILGWISYFIATRKSKKVLIELVGCPYDAYSNLGTGGKILAPFARALTRWQVRRAPFCIYVTKSYLQTKYPSNGTTRSISNVHLPLGQKEPHRRNSNGTVRIGSIGQTDVKYKGFHIMIEALPHLPEVHYEIVGRGDNTALRKLAEAHGVSDRVTFCGPLAQGDVLEWLDSLDVFVQPSLTEGLPRAVIEAMSTALPVIGSDVGGIPELIESEWLFPPGDIRALVSTLESLLENDDLAAIGRANYYRSQDYRPQKLRTVRTEILTQFLHSVEN